MLECLRKLPRSTFKLKCIKCGVSRDLENDETRTRHAKMHSSSCPAAPAGEPRLEMVSLDHLKMLAADDTLWFEIVRTAAEEDGRPRRRGSA